MPLCHLILGCNQWIKYDKNIASACVRKTRLIFSTATPISFLRYHWSIQTPPVLTLPPNEKLEFGFGLLGHFEMQTQPSHHMWCHVNVACNPWLETWDVAMIYTGGTRTCSMDYCWPHDILPSKMKSTLNCRCQLTCSDWGTPNTRLKFCQCTPTALLCYPCREMFKCM